MKYLLLIPACIVFLYGCKECSSKQVTCPAYEEKGFSSWFPYAANQRIYFVSGTSKDSFTVASVDQSEPYKTRVSASSPWCGAHKYFYSVEKFPNSYSKFQATDDQQTDSYNSGSFEEQIQLIMIGSVFTGKGMSDTGMVKSSYSVNRSQFYTSIILGGVTYSSVQEMISDTTSLKTQRAYKIWISKNNGIIGYEEYPSLKLWTKQ